MVPTCAISAESLTFLAFLPISAMTWIDGLVDAALQIHRVHAGSNRLQAFADDGLGQNGGRRGAVTGDVVGLGGDFAHHLRAHVLELVFKFDFLGDGDAVLGGARARRTTSR